MSGEKIVVIEDEADILEVMEYNLKREGFQVSTAQDGLVGLGRVRQEHPAMVILDLMLPGSDGIEVCRQLKAEPATRAIPVIMVTAKGEESDVVLGLGVGADDYITKPFSPKEFLARIKAVLRRGHPRPDPIPNERVVREGVTIDAGRHEVRVSGRREVFTATEFRLLHFLASHPGRVFTRDQLLNRAIGEEAFIIDRNIDVHVRAIRKKLGTFRNLVETIRGVGYRFKDLD